MVALKSKAGIFLLLTALLPFLTVLMDPPSVMLFLYSIFVFVYFFFAKKWQFKVLKWGSVAVIVSTALIVLFMSESIAWIDQLWRQQEGALFYPDYFPNLAIGSGFYIGMAAVWFLLNTYFSFTTREAFVTYGLFGIFFEQLAAVFLQAVAFLFSNPLASVYLVVFVFLVHGSILGLMHMRMKPLFKGTRNTIWKYPVAIIVIAAGAYAGTFVTFILTTCTVDLPEAACPLYGEMTETIAP